MCVQDNRRPNWVEDFYNSQGLIESEDPEDCDDSDAIMGFNDPDDDRRDDDDWDDEDFGEDEGDDYDDDEW